jgi:archaeal type IV pilus assembly protein PilA
MNVFDRASQRWKKSRKRGVSPIIATILLVAITVVLAAVLYVLISGLTHTGVASPYSVNYGTPAPASCTTTTTPSCATAVYWESVSIFVTAGLTTSALGLQLLSSTGSVIASGAAPASGNCKAGILLNTTSTTKCIAGASGPYIVLENATGYVANVFSSGKWTGSTVTVPASGDSVIVISATSLLGSGDQLNAYSLTSSASVSGTSNGF